MQVIWPTIFEVLDIWKVLSKSKQSGQGKQGENKSYDTLISNMSDPFIPVKLCLKTLQTKLTSS